MRAKAKRTRKPKTVKGEVVKVGAALVPARPTALMVADAEAVRETAASARAPRTQHLYSRAFGAFEVWCHARGEVALPASPEVVALYLTTRSTGSKKGEVPKVKKVKVSTIGVDLAAILRTTRTPGLEAAFGRLKDSIWIRDTMAGIRRKLGVAPTQKAAVTAEDVALMVRTGVPSWAVAKSVRDRALLLVGFAGGFRRSELAALNLEDVSTSDKGVTVTVRRSKTDQEGEGREVGIYRGKRAKVCPVRALQAWIKLLEGHGEEHPKGALFRSVSRYGTLGPRISGRDVAMVVKAYAEAAGLPPEQYAGHSLRSGLVTSATLAGKSMDSIMRQTGHKSEAMVRRYIRHATLFEDNASEGLL